jgi:hypothetical protein
MDWEWIQSSFASLPGCNDLLFHKLWKEKRLRFDGGHCSFDEIDQYNARLVCAALSRGSSLFVGLPDLRSHRPALLFATGLIQQWLDTRRSGAHTGPVLYFGSTVGIREQLHHTSIQGMRVDLADVFRQQNVGRVARPGGHVNLLGDTLPHVITIYAPADPAAMIAQYRPRWIAADCGDAPSCIWLATLLQCATAHNLSVIGWGQNPLAYCVADFEKTADVFLWPPNAAPAGSVRAILESSPAIEMRPLVLQGTQAEALSLSLQKAGRALVQAAQHSAGQLGRDTLNIHWNYLRSLEALPAPLDFFESEALDFWGLKSFAQLRNGCAHFRAAYGQIEPTARAPFAQATQQLDQALAILSESEPPLWTALSNFCVEEPAAGVARLITFPSRNRRHIFLSALLARYNMTEVDMRELRVWVVGLDDLRRWVRQMSGVEGAEPDPWMPYGGLQWQPLLVGVPSPFVTPKLLPMLVQGKVDVLVYPHQLFALERRAGDWSQRLSPDTDRLAAILRHFTGESATRPASRTRKKLPIGAPFGVDVHSARIVGPVQTQSIWQPEDPVAEITRLLGGDAEVDEELPVRDQPEGAAVELTSEETTALWCDAAVEVRFDQGWRALFALNETINVVVNTPVGAKIHERYVRAIKSGDAVLFIHGQQRQNLYELILSRVHRHPSIELHVALIRRWQEDFKKAYSRWECQAVSDLAELRGRGIRNLNALLRAMRERGCTLSCELTIQFWREGRTLCPKDPEDLRRLAEVLNLSFVRQHYRRIHSAATRLRGLHIGLSQKLNRWLEQQASGSTDHVGDEVIDPELGLTFEDFRSSLLNLKVKSVRNLTGPFLRSSLGTLVKD